MWGRQSSKTRPSLFKPPYIASPEPKDWGVGQDWVSEQTQYPNRIGVICGVVTPTDSVWIDKAPLHKTTAEKKN